MWKIKKPSWEKKSFPYEIGRDGFNKLHLKKDKNGWFDAIKYRPLQYELVRIKTNSESMRRKTGWWTGLKWEGLRLQKEESVLYWKPDQEET